MKKKIGIAVAIILVIVVLACVATIRYLRQFHFSTQLTFVSEHALSTPASRFDYQAFGVNGFLYMNHMGNDSVVVYDTHTNAIVKEITGIGSPRGIDFSFTYDRAYVTSPDSDEVFVIDTTDNTITQKIAVGADPDGIAVDDDDSKVFVTNESGNSVSVIDQTTLQEMKKIPLTASVGNTKYDSVHHKVYTAVHDGTFVVIDPLTLTVEKIFTLKDCSTPHGFALDADSQQALVTCQGNSVGIILDLATGNELYRATVGAGADVVAVDAQRHLGIVSSASGIASVFQFGDTPKNVGDQFIATNAHTVAVDSSTGLVYFPLQNIHQATLKVYSFH